LAIIVARYLVSITVLLSEYKPADWYTLSTEYMHTHFGRWIKHRMSLYTSSKVQLTYCVSKAASVLGTETTYTKWITVLTNMILNT